MEHYDLIVIGAGPGGYTAAIKAAGFGMKVIVIEKDKLGGNCISRGCIPTKALLYASSLFSMMQKSDEFGVYTDFISFDYKKMQDYKKRSVLQYRQGIQNMFEKNGVTFVKGTATIHREKIVEVNGDEGQVFYHGDNIIIATGAKPVDLNIPGIDLPGVCNSDKFLSARHWEYDRVLILGGGVIGVEFATFFQSLCAKATIVEQGPQLLGPMDPDVSRGLERQMREKGIQIYCDCTLEEITREGELSCRIRNHKTGEELQVKASQVIVAIGRNPCMDDLLGDDIHLETRNGRLVVDHDFMTSEMHIYAVGDVASKTRLAHLAMAQGTYVVEKIAGRPHTVQLEATMKGTFVSLPIVPSCIYTVPEIATVGITEQTARTLGLKVRCGLYDMNDNGKSIITRKEAGFIRLIFEARTNTLIGAQIVCPRATDMIGEMATAVANGLTAEQLSRAMRAHPTYSEGIAAAIEDAMKEEAIQDE